MLTATSSGEQIHPFLTIEQIRSAASRFHGDMDQMPPPFSAKKIAGTPAYKLARAGKPVELKTAKISIRSFEITAVRWRRSCVHDER